jgi:hypothetical protein
MRGGPRSQPATAVSICKILLSTGGLPAAFWRIICSMALSKPS